MDPKDRNRVVSFYQRVHRALTARPAGPFNLDKPDEAAALAAMTVVSVFRQHEGHEPDAVAEIRIAAELFERTAIATSIPRELLKRPH